MAMIPKRSLDPGVPSSEMSTIRGDFSFIRHIDVIRAFVRFQLTWNVYLRALNIGVSRIILIRYLNVQPEERGFPRTRLKETPGLRQPLWENLVYLEHKLTSLSRERNVSSSGSKKKHRNVTNCRGTLWKLDDRFSVSRFLYLT